jgi:hypothetical protein
MVVFSEGTRHTGSTWTCRDHPRNAVLMAYNGQTVRHHEPKPCVHPDLEIPRREQIFSFRARSIVFAQP